MSCSSADAKPKRAWPTSQPDVAKLIFSLVSLSLFLSLYVSDPCRSFQQCSTRHRFGWRWRLQCRGKLITGGQFDCQYILPLLPCLAPRPGMRVLPFRGFHRCRTATAANPFHHLTQSNDLIAIVHHHHHRREGKVNWVMIYWLL